MSARHVRLTTRGAAFAVAGTLTTTAGVLVGVDVVVRAGALLLLVVAASTALLTAEAHRHERGGLRLTRTVEPHPVTVGEGAVVSVEVVPTRTGVGAPRVDRLQIAERAARELSGGRPLRARVTRSRESLRLTYPVTPERRGRWGVGPVQLHRRDLFGLATWTGPLGEPTRLAVRPAVVPLAVSSSAMSSDVDRAAAGARTPAADDTSLRPYQSGDDLRRVHWRSSARRGELVVRQDERSGRRPASVVLDLPQDDDACEWSIRLAASLAVALVGAGHHVRLLGGDVLGAAADHHRPDAGGSAVAALLDQTVDLRLPAARAEREQWFTTAVETLRADGGGAELVFAVLGELEAGPLGALAGTGETTHGWAMVRASESTQDVTSIEARRTADRLRRAGWTVCLVHPGEDLGACWARLVASDKHLVVTR